MKSVGDGLRGAIEPVNHPALYQVVVEHIRRAIHIGSLVPGDKLPPERQLAKQLTVARATLRQAIRVLEGEGYVATRHSGIVVLDPSSSAERFAPFAHIRLTEMEQNIDFLFAVECRAARLAAVRRSQNQLLQLEESFQAMEGGWDTPHFRAQDAAFHLGIAEASGNGWIRRAIEDLRVAMWFPDDPLTSSSACDAQLHHGRILSAIRDRDPDAAEAAVAEHIESTRHDLYDIAAERGVGPRAHAGAG